MSTRRAKQLIYGVLYLIILMALVALVYFVVQLVAPAPAAVAPCTENCMPVGASAIVTSTVQTFVTAPGHYTFLTQIADASAGYAAQYFDYSIDLYNASGTVVQSIPGSSFIYANQTKYLVVPNVTAPAFVGAGVSISNVYWVPSATLGALPQFSKENITTVMVTSPVSVSGQITNSNLSTFRYVYVDVIFLGADKRPIGASQTVLNDVAPNSTVDFSVLYPQTGAIDPTANQILVYGLK
ncbi:MAG: hypothetical protein P4L67_02590 [Candidatus Pacebacteria bacterium]|nr:hypothetical protein [Candidatus Paceibacterota bacterium]